jgi:hypothetical protein
MTCELAELGAGGAVSLPGALDSAAEHMAGDDGKDDGVPAHRWVQAVLGDEVEEPSRGAGFPVLATRRRDRIGPAGWHVRVRIPLHHAAMIRNRVLLLGRGFVYSGQWSLNPACGTVSSPRGCVNSQQVKVPGVWTFSDSAQQHPQRTGLLPRLRDCRRTLVDTVFRGLFHKQTVSGAVLAWKPRNRYN